MNIAVCGMVKDDNHRTRGLFYNNEELPIDRGSELFKLITRIQDETHRFAIEYHRNLRQKNQVRSILDDISGIGPKRRRALMKYFQSLEAVQAAEVDEIMKVPAMNRQAAEEVFEFFHKQPVQ
jgi:excinuclease ABC subunit C